jgi:hypothetical protein
LLLSQVQPSFLCSDQVLPIVLNCRYRFHRSSFMLQQQLLLLPLPPHRLQP